MVGLHIVLLCKHLIKRFRSEIVIEDILAKFMWQIGPFDGGGFAAHDAEAIEVDHFCAKLNAETTSEEWICADDLGIENFAGDGLTTERHFLRETVEEFCGFGETGVFDEGADTLQSGEDAFLGKLAEGMADGVASGIVELA